MKPPQKNEIRKPSKTLAGVTPVAVMLPPRKCKHGTCVYCPTLGVPQSYTPKSPAVMRAILLNYDAFKQVSARLQAYKAMHHPTDKIELIIMGGTFLEYPEKFQIQFIKDCYDALNTENKFQLPHLFSVSKTSKPTPLNVSKKQKVFDSKISKNLEEAKKVNETAKYRCVALCIETRPDVCTSKHIKKMLEFGCTRVELGVQIPDDKIYKIIQRHHTVKSVIDATQILKDAGFKVGYHIMPGIPGSNQKKDIEMFKKIFSDENFKPDQLKIYPCQVIRGSQLENLYYQGKYIPYSKEQIKNTIIQMLKLTPRYCRVMRIMRELPPEYIIAGTTRIDLRKDIEAELRKQPEQSKIKEIRFREIGFNISKNIDKNLKLKITKYKASQGDEYFLEIINKDDILFGLLRLRISKKAGAIIRELHVYGKAVEIGKKGVLGQHTGLGKQLMQKAEEIAKQNKVETLKVISGVGVREYYKKLGYTLKDFYMTKEL